METCSMILKDLIKYVFSPTFCAPLINSPYI